LQANKIPLSFVFATSPLQEINNNDCYDNNVNDNYILNIYNIINSNSNCYNNEIMVVIIMVIIITKNW